MEESHRKALLFSGGHIKETPATINFAIVVSCDTVCLNLSISELNDHEVKFGDVISAYITAPIE